MENDPVTIPAPPKPVPGAVAPMEGMKTLPVGMPLMADAWFGCLLFTANQRSSRDAFREETGFNLEGLVTATPIEHLIDKATGHERAVVIAFADWVTKHVWGEEGKS